MRENNMYQKITVIIKNGKPILNNTKLCEVFRQGEIIFHCVEIRDGITGGCKSDVQIGTMRNQCRVLHKDIAGVLTLIKYYFFLDVFSYSP